MNTTLVAIFLVAIAVTSTRASPLEDRPLKDDAESYPVDDADYDMSGDGGEWPEDLEIGEPSELYLQEVREQLENRSIPQTEPLTRFRRQCQNIPGTMYGDYCNELHVYHIQYD